MDDTPAPQGEPDSGQLSPMPPPVPDPGEVSLPQDPPSASPLPPLDVPPSSPQPPSPPPSFDLSEPPPLNQTPVPEGEPLGVNPVADKPDVLAQQQVPIANQGSSPLPPPPPPPPQSGEVSLMGSVPSGEGGMVPPEEKHFFGRKTLLIVCIIIAVLGIVIGAFLFMQKRAESTPPPKPQATNEPTPKPKEVFLPVTLSLERPLDGEISTTGDILIKGKATAQTSVIFFTDSDQDSTQADATGQFSGKLSLKAGINDIFIITINGKGDEKSEIRQVVYDNQ